MILLFVSNSWHLCCCQSTGRSWNKLSRMIQVVTSKLCLLNSARFVCLKMASVYLTNKHGNKWGNERTDRLTSKRTNEYEQPSPFIHGLHYVFICLKIYFHKLTYINTEVNEIWIKEKFVDFVFPAFRVNGTKALMWVTTWHIKTQNLCWRWESLGIKIAEERAQFPLTNFWKSQESWDGLDYILLSLKATFRLHPFNSEIHTAPLTVYQFLIPHCSQQAGIKKWGTDEETFITIFTTRSFPQLKLMLPEYKKVNTEFSVCFWSLLSKTFSSVFLSKWSLLIVPRQVFLGLIANKADLEVTRQTFPANFFV